MEDSDLDTDDRSLVATFRWLLFDQFDDTTEDTMRQGFVFIGMATSFLALVGATSAFVASPQLYWVTLALGVLGIATLTFTWMLVQNQLEGLFSSGPEPTVEDEPTEADETVGSESDVEA